MLDAIHSHLDPKLIHEWQSHRYLSLETLKRLLDSCRSSTVEDISLERLNQAFNNSDLSREALRFASTQGSRDAVLLDMLPASPDLSGHYEILEDGLYHELSSHYWADQAGYLAAGHVWYPLELDDRKFGFRTDWIKRVLGEAMGRLQDFSSSRTSDIAIIVGNGPSLRNEDFSLLEGQDVFISNYAIKHPWLARIARGIAVSNPWVAAQEPYWFNLASCWKFFPFWHGESIQYDESCVFLNAYGGDLFFSTHVAERIAWHSTVTFFWLQILYSAGYRKIVLVGVDNFYQQPVELKEGDLIDQKTDDPNHFDPAYFKGRRWQAADTGKMEETYAMAKEYYERDGREIVNCTSGGSLELFRRSQIAREIHRPVRCVKRSTEKVMGANDVVCPPVVPERRRSFLIESSAGNNGEFSVKGQLAGRELVAVVEVQAAAGSKVDICLSGGDTAAADRTSKCYAVQGSGKNWISVRHLFANDHEKVRVEVFVNDVRSHPACPPYEIYVMESPASVFNRLSSNDGLFAEANTLTRGNLFLSSIPLYLYLAMIRPLEIYKIAVKTALDGLGITAVADQEEVLRQLGYHPNLAGSDSPRHANS
jgi:hypothetical protein